MAEWNGDATKLQQICQLFSLASSPDNQIQQQVVQTLNQLSTMPDFTLYLVTVFAKLRDQPEVVRQRAGLLLKTNLQAQGIQPQVAEYVQAHTLALVRDPSKVIRHTAGTVITTIVSKVGVASCSQTLDGLANLLRDPNPEVVEGSFNALNKICEDGVSVLRQTWSTPPAETTPFVRWCAERLLPVLLEYASPQAPLQARQHAIECLNHFALQYLFNDPSYPNLQPYAAKYVETLGVLAQDNDVKVLEQVCKGFVCVIENQWECSSPHMREVVLQYMLKASQHPEYSVRLEALEIWTPCTHSPQMVALIRPMLPQLIPVLLQNMIYTQADYMGMEASQINDDNAAVPDSAEDIRPRHHKETGDDDDEDGGHNGGGAWGAEWTARKAAASSLDNLASCFRGDTPQGGSKTFLEIVLPLIEQRLGASHWEVQESGVLALGAIAFGCMQSLLPFLPRVMELLLRLCESEKPLVRSISCWCTSRFSQWICHSDNVARDQVLRSVLTTLLQRVVDKNKPVQEAACSAFATLEEEARWLLVPFLDDIVQKLVQAFQYYQAKNLLILYDAVGTLAEAVGSALDSPQYVQALMVPLMQKFDTVADNDRSIVALFECLSQLTNNLGRALMPIVPKLVERCVRLVLQGAKAAQMWQQNPNEFEKPDREVMAASIDLLAGIVEGLQGNVGEVLAQHNFICIVPEVLKDNGLQVKQSALALVGDCAKNCTEYLVPFLPEILPACAKCLNDDTSASVSNNASWAVGEICLKVGPDTMRIYLEPIVRALVSVLRKHSMHMHTKVLVQNACITIGRLGLVCGQDMGKVFPEFARIWLEIMAGVRNDLEKATAFQGLCCMIQANPQACVSCMPQLFAAICSFHNCPPQLEPSFREILGSYKQLAGAGWSTVYAQTDQETQIWLAHFYGIDAA